MSRNVFCTKLKRDAPGLDIPPFPGDQGTWIFNNISQEAWKAWQQHEVRLINEKKLNLADPKTRQYLNEQRQNFFTGKSYDVAEGFIDPQNR